MTMIVAHRGASSDAPENTLAAFRLAWKQGADAVECDLRRTADGRLVCIHDDDTKRVTGRHMKVAESDFAALRALDAGAWKGPEFTGEKIPSAEDVFSTVPAHGKIFIEIKDGPESVTLVKQAIADTGLADEQCVVIAFDPAAIAESRRQMPGVMTLWTASLIEHHAGQMRAMDGAYGTLTEDEAREFAQRTADPATILDGTLTPSAEMILDTLKKTGADGINLGIHPRLDAEFLRPMLAAKKLCGAWTIDDPADAARCAKLGLFAITTNRPGWLREIS